MAVVRWRFEDTATADTYTFEINPDAGGTPGYSKKFQYEATAAADGNTIIFEGRDDPQKIDFSGTLNTESHFTALATWWDKRTPVRLIDDLGRTFTIVIEKFTPTRKRNSLYPWRHEFSISATVVG